MLCTQSIQLLTRLREECMRLDPLLQQRQILAVGLPDSPRGIVALQPYQLECRGTVDEPFTEIFERMLRLAYRVPVGLHIFMRIVVARLMQILYKDPQTLFEFHHLLPSANFAFV